MKLVMVVFLLFVSNVFAGDISFDKGLANYEKLHQAFFDRDLHKVHVTASELLKDLSAIKDPKMIKTLTYSMKKLKALAKIGSLEEGKGDLNTISQGILVVLEKQAPHKDYARYYCPMEKKYWIQNTSKEKEVMNPYASKMMPHCGERQKRQQEKK